MYLLDLIRGLLSTDFMPHAYCLRDPALIAVHALADSIIALSYLLIPTALLVFVRRRRDLIFPWMFTLFAVFILGCGATHILAVVTLWSPVYRLDAALKVVTALASIATAVMLFRLLPQLILIPSPLQLREVNLRLEEAAAEAEAANRAKSTFLSTMSHEIRTPLNAILGYAQLMARDAELGPSAKANLKIIGRSGEHLLSLINAVLDMSKIEAGKAEINLVTFNVYRLLDDLSSMFRLRAETKGLRFEMLVDGESVPYVLADEGKLRQALINLLGNAIKFTEQGHVELRVTLEKRVLEMEEKPQERFWLSAQVEDSGMGMSEEEQKKLFEPFRQTQGGLGIQHGTGLGLAITRQFARLMGGDVTVSSNPGHGSIFRFEIPIERGDPGVAVKRASPRHVVGLRSGSSLPRILVVDDQFENRDWLMKLLASVGFSVRGADTGAAAVQEWAAWTPDLILMDVHMPVMDGLEATRRIRVDPRGKETAILVLTASAMEHERRAVAQSGANGFLSKPLREDELLEKIRSMLDIVYSYEEMNETAREAENGTPSLSSKQLGGLPAHLLEELRAATLNGDKRLLDRLIVKVSESGETGCGRGLRELVDKYEYDALTQLLEEARHR